MDTHLWTGTLYKHTLMDRHMNKHMNLQTDNISLWTTISMDRHTYGQTHIWADTPHKHPLMDTHKHINLQTDTYIYGQP